MTTLFQYCDKCKTERNFDPDTLKCKTCNNKNRKPCENQLKLFSRMAP